MKILRPLMTQPPSTFFAVVSMSATSEPASGSVIPRQKIFSPLIAGHEVALLLFLGPELVDGRNGHVGLDRDRHRNAARVAAGHLLGQHDVAEVVAAAAAVLLGVGEARGSPARPSA